MEQGSGPPILLLHGFPETSRSFRHNQSALAARGRRVIALDLKGYGRSDKPRPGEPGGDYRATAVAKELAAVIAALGYDRMDIVGHDWGGILLAAMLLDQPERIRRAVFLNAPFRRVLPWTLPHVYRFNVPGLPERQFYRRPMRFIGAIFDRWCARREAITPEDLRIYVRSLQTDGSITCALAYYRALRRELTSIVRAQTARLPAETTPRSLVLFGAEDPIMPPTVARMAARDLPGAELHLVKGAGHFVQSEAPAEVNRALIRFLIEEG